MSTKKIKRAAAEERREYYRQWRKENRERVKQYNQNYWQHRAEKKATEQEENNGETCI